MAESIAFGGLKFNRRFTTVAPVTGSAPTVTGISPGSGTALGGTSVTITGTNFTGATAVSVDGVALASFSVNSSTTITGTTAAASNTGTGDVAVTAPLGTGKLINGWTYTFSPSDVSNLTAWFRADLGVTLNGSNVSNWADQSGNGFDVQQSNPSFQPAFLASSTNYNNQPIVSPSGGRNLVRSTTPSNAQPATALFVGASSGPNGDVPFALGNASNGPFIEVNNALLLAYAGASLSTSLAITTPAAFYVEFNGTSGRACRNNWLTGGTSGNTGTSALAGIGIGAASDGTFAATCDCAEFIVYSRILSAAEQSLLASYITSRYGFTIT